MGEEGLGEVEGWRRVGVVLYILFEVLPIIQRAVNGILYL